MSSVVATPNLVNVELPEPILLDLVVLYKWNCTVVTSVGSPLWAAPLMPISLKLQGTISSYKTT